MESVGFPPIVGRDPVVLILGTLPSVRSIETQQYYGHPRNTFWPIMARYWGFQGDLDYTSRRKKLTDTPVIVWDVLKQAVRPGSLDANIQREGLQVNDFRSLLAHYPLIRGVLFNGAEAERLFQRHVSLDGKLGVFKRMPSTSPANAGISFEDKYRLWSIALDQVLAGFNELGDK